jgi:hypothetical protein
MFVRRIARGATRQLTYVEKTFDTTHQIDAADNKPCRSGCLSDASAMGIAEAKGHRHFLMPIHQTTLPKITITLMVKRIAPPFMEEHTLFWPSLEIPL